MSPSGATASSSATPSGTAPSSRATPTGAGPTPTGAAPSSLATPSGAPPSSLPTPASSRAPSRYSQSPQELCPPPAVSYSVTSMPTNTDLGLRQQQSSRLQTQQPHPWAAPSGGLSPL